MAHTKKIKITAKELKIKELYDFYLQYGFNHTVEEMARLMHIERKTFYNRYGTREHSIDVALGYEHQRQQASFKEKFLQCNHSVEELMMLICSLQQYYNQRPHFFMYDAEHYRFATDATPYKSAFEAIVEKGLRNYHVQEDVNIPLYIDFFFTNIQSYILQNRKQTGLVRYTLLPLLNERGLELLDELDIELLLA